MSKNVLREELLEALSSAILAGMAEAKAKGISEDMSFRLIAGGLIFQRLSEAFEARHNGNATLFEELLDMVEQTCLSLNEKPMPDGKFFFPVGFTYTKETC